jgi:hypothetical protein
MAKLAALLTAKMQADGLNFTSAAAKLKLSAPSLRAILDGRSAPNSRSVPKYAKFLGISTEQVIAAGGQRGGGKGAKRRGSPPGKVKGKRGRPRLPGVAKGTIKLLADHLGSIQKRVDRMNKVIERIATN